MKKIEIVPYSPELAPHFERINLRWLNAHFKIEPIDQNLLSDPQKYIIDQGGEVYFALVDGEVAGTCALEKHPDGSFELIKMGVDPQFQGLGIGKRLGLHTLERAKALGADRIWLASSRKLDVVLNLYRKLGFKEFKTDYTQTGYERCDLTMELNL